MTTWKPATCGTTQLDRTSCVVEVETQTFTVTCPAHSLVSAGTRFVALTDENRRGWGNVYGELLAAAPNQAPAILDSINMTWQWTGTAPNRVLTITVTGITLNNPQKQNVQNKLDARFGAGNVVAVFP